MASVQPVQPARPARRQAPRAALALVAVGLLLGIVSAAVVVVRVAPAFGNAMSAPERTVPVDATLDLEGAAYTVYELTGSRRSVGGVSVSTNRAPTVSADDVQVTSPQGTGLPVTSPGINETLQRGSTVWTAVARFVAPAPGSYRVVVDGRPDVRVVVARSVFSVLGGALTWLAVGAFAGVLLLVGLVWLAVRALRGRRTAGAAGRAGPPPPGWYPDPGRPGAHRWWDGVRWLDPPA